MRYNTQLLILGEIKDNENILRFNNKYIKISDTASQKFCSNCHSQHVYKRIELLNQFKCEFRPTYKTAWRLIDPANGTCTRCGIFIINDTGVCPECHGVTKKQWKQIKVRVRPF